MKLHFDKAGTTPCDTIMASPSSAGSELALTEEDRVLERKRLAAAIQGSQKLEKAKAKAW